MNNELFFIWTKVCDIRFVQAASLISAVIHLWLAFLFLRKQLSFLSCQY